MFLAAAWETQLAEQAIMDVIHLRVAGEEAEGTALGDIEDAPDLFRGGPSECRRARIRHVWRNIEYGLLAVIEV